MIDLEVIRAHNEVRRAFWDAWLQKVIREAGTATEITAYVRQIGTGPDGTCDNIDSLLAEVERLREVLRSIAEGRDCAHAPYNPGGPAPHDCYDLDGCFQETAEEALRA